MAARMATAEPTAETWPRQELAAALTQDLPGLETIRLLLAHPDWVHRRVDALEYRDDTTFRRRQSVHFTVPDAAPELRVARASFRLIPLTTLRKETLVNFDCRDESGAALPILNRAQRGALLVRGMTSWAEGIVAAPLDEDVAADIARLIAAPPPGADSTGSAGSTAAAASTASTGGATTATLVSGSSGARDRFRSGAGQRAVLVADDLFTLVLDRLTDQFVLTTLVGDPPGTQRIVKFSYEELGDLAPEPWPRAPLAALCWIPRQAASPTESLFSTESYHFEADLPPGVDVPVGSLWVGPSDDELACVDVDPGDHLRIALRTSGHERGVAEARWSLRPARRGWLRTAWFATMVAAVTLAVGAWRLDTITAGVEASTRSELAAAVILAVIGALGSLVARIEEHPLISRLLEWPRRLAAVDAVLPFVAAASLVVGPAGDGRRVLWALLAAVAGVIAVIFTVAFVGPTTAADRPPSRTPLNTPGD
jgi:hypothetical protein